MYMQHTNDSKTHRMATMTNINDCKQNFDIFCLIILQNGLSDIAKTYCKIQFISCPCIFTFMGYKCKVIFSQMKHIHLHYCNF